MQPEWVCDCGPLWPRATRPRKVPPANILVGDWECGLCWLLPDETANRSGSSREFLQQPAARVEVVPFPKNRPDRRSPRPLVLQIRFNPLFDPKAALVLGVEAHSERLIGLPPANLGPNPDPR